MKKTKTIIAWAGFVEGKIDTGWRSSKDFKDTTHGIYKTKMEASENYQDVRKVKISYELPQ